MRRDLYSQGDNGWTIIIGSLILAAASIAFAVFASDLRQRLADAGAPGAGRLTFAGALLFAAVTIAGAVVLAWIPMAKELGNSPVPDGELNYMTTVVGYGFILMAGGVTAALMLVTAGRASVRTGVLPAWLGRAGVGVVVGVIPFLLAMVFIPMALLVLWVLITVIVMNRRVAVAPPAASRRNWRMAARGLVRLRDGRWHPRGCSPRVFALHHVAWGGGLCGELLRFAWGGGLCLS